MAHCDRINTVKLFTIMGSIRNPRRLAQYITRLQRRGLH
jgi:hypothetical protein